MTQRMYDTRSVAAHFSRAAGTYDAHAALQLSYNQQAFDWFSEHLSANARILDAGSGTGAFARYAKPLKPEWQIFGCDIAPAMCEAAQPFQQATFCADMQQWPVANNTLDALLCTFALQWSNAPETLIANMAQSLKPNAPLVLYSFSEGTLMELREATRYAGASHVVSQFHPVEHYTDWVRSAGLTIVTSAAHEHVEYFKNAEALFTHLKLMGASNSLANRSKNLGNRGELKKISQSYAEHFSHIKGIAATWKVVSVTARK